MRRSLRRPAIVSSFVLLLLPLASAPSFAGQGSPAQSSPGTGWVVEVHLGAMPGRVPSNVVTSQLPPPGPSFLDVLGNTTRRVPSWYFGDGALLANQVINQTGDAGHIVPLDPVLTTASASRQSGADFGVRIGHTITRRVLLAFSFDQVGGRFGLTSDAMAAIAATNASFKPYWAAVITRPQTGNVMTSSAFTIADNSGTEKLFTVAAEVRIATIHGWTPYVTGGGGFALTLPSDGPTVTLIGNYRFNFVNPGAGNDGALVSETDQVQVRYQAQPVPIGIFGVGVERDLMSHIGVRADLRYFVGANSLRIRVDTQPVSLPGPPFVNQRRGMNPSLQINNTLVNTSLSLQGVDHFTSFEGTGSLPSFSAGLFVRF